MKTHFQNLPLPDKGYAWYLNSEVRVDLSLSPSRSHREETRDKDGIAKGDDREKQKEDRHTSR